MAKDNPKQSTEDPTHAAVVSIARQRGLGFRETDPLWKRKISEYLNAAQADYADPDKGFDWGTFDCCTFAFDWVQLITGVDPMQQFRGKYSTALTASRALKKIGAGKSVV